MADQKRPPANAFVRIARKVYNPLHFTRGYNFVLFFIFGGALLGFSAARFMYLNLDGIFCNRLASGGSAAAPGECYYYSGEGGQRYRIGILLHLATILPAAVLVVVQFTPVVRHKFLLFHRVNGYVILVLSLVSVVGILMIMEISFGAHLALRAAGGFVCILFVGSLGLAYYNVKRLQIEQHRAWMLRAWFYAGIIITIRINMVIAATVVSQYGSFFEARRCEDIDYMFFNFQNYTELLYPECTAWYSGANPHQYAVVQANLNGDPAQASTALNMSFTMAAWLSLAMHAIGVEVYLHLTPREAERLRNVSYQRQVEAGMKNPGNAGLTAQRLGDANPWTPDEHSSNGEIKALR